VPSDPAKLDLPVGFIIRGSCLTVINEIIVPAIRLYGFCRFNLAHQCLTKLSPAVSSNQTRQL